mmetsp:Transcript_46268/g.122762  ORF Transcript_46268/g.122762 Transcript_46268/m.122762 type:complete len:237 (+) Transcript_46268:196-906(+)
MFEDFVSFRCSCIVTFRAGLLIFLVLSNMRVRDTCAVMFLRMNSRARVALSRRSSTMFPASRIVLPKSALLKSIHRGGFAIFMPKTVPSSPQGYTLHFTILLSTCHTVSLEVKSATAPLSVVITGSPHAMASAMLTPKLSALDTCTNTSLSANNSVTSDDERASSKTTTFGACNFSGIAAFKASHASSSPCSEWTTKHTGSVSLNSSRYAERAASAPFLRIMAPWYKKTRAFSPHA